MGYFFLGQTYPWTRHLPRVERAATREEAAPLKVQDHAQVVRSAEQLPVHLPLAADRRLEMASTLAATARGRLARTNYALRLSGAALIGATLRIVGYGTQGIAARSPALCALLYLLPLAGIAITAAMLLDAPLIPERLRQLFARSAGAQAT